jgi:serine/threonine-protein kinase
LTSEDQQTVSLRGALPPPTEHAAGARVGAWTIVRKLGGGGFGNVYEVRHHASGAPAALKLLHAHFTASSEMLARFEREIHVLRRLRHSNVVAVIDAGFDAGRPFLCMELLQGEELSRMLAVRPLDVREALRLFEPLCDAVSTAHALGVIHRDIKASNVYVCADGRPVLLDFGIAKLSDALAPELTASHQALGTPGCMAPEQIHGHRVDARADVYALGSLLFHMLTARLPFHDPSPTMTQYLHLHARRPRASSIVPVATAIDDVIIRAMAIEPNQRFADVASLLGAVRTAARESRHDTNVRTVEQAAIFITLEDLSGGIDLDEKLIADLEAVLPAAERMLAERGFSLVLDLGTSALFLAPRERAAAIDDALATWQSLAARPTRDRRVRVGMCVHGGVTRVVGNRVEPCALLRPETWGMPDPLEGVWVTDTPPRQLR